MPNFRLLLLLTIIPFMHHAIGQNEPDLNLEEIYTNFSLPLALTHCGDDRIFIVEKAGKIIAIEKSTGERYTFLDIQDIVSINSNERGLLGLAFHPNFDSNGFFFVNFTNNQGNTEIQRYQVFFDNPKLADPNSGLSIITIDQPYGNHNGGCIAFGPDNYLYIGMGDGGSGGDPQNFAQNPNSYLGKMLRLNVDASTPSNPYFIPAENPGSTPIVYTGLRNPWRFSFDQVTGDLWIGDVGQNLWEEIDLVPADQLDSLHNFGWRCYEGDAPYNTSGCDDADTYTAPVVVYNSNTQGCSVTGGHVYRGCKYPNLVGMYLYTDYCSGLIWGVRYENGEVTTPNQLLNGPNQDFVSLGEDAEGNLYVIGIVSGKVYAITDNNLEESYSLNINPISCDKSELGSISFISDYDASSWVSIQLNNTDYTDLIFNNLNEGDYTLSLMNENNCMMSLQSSFISPSIASETLNLSVVADPLNPDNDSLATDLGFDNYTWDIDGIVQDDNSNQILIGPGGLYTLTVWNDDRPDCTLTASIFLTTHVEEIAKMSNIKVSPNPINDVLTIKGLENALDQDYQIQIVDPSGKFVYNEVVNAAILANGINLDHLVHGNYLIILRAEANQEVIRLKFSK